MRSPALELSVAYAHVRNGDCQQRCSTSVAGRATGVRPVRIAVVIVVLALSGLTAVGIGSGASSRQRTVPCSETIDITRFPYLGSNRPQERYRLVLGVISAPRAFFRQVVFGNGYANWPYFFKAGMVIRGGGKGVVVSVPRAWRNRGGHRMGQRRQRRFRHASLRRLPRLPNKGPRVRGRLLSPFRARLSAVGVPRGTPRCDGEIRSRSALQLVARVTGSIGAAAREETDLPAPISSSLACCRPRPRGGTPARAR